MSSKYKGPSRVRSSEYDRGGTRRGTACSAERARRMKKCYIEMRVRDRGRKWGLGMEGSCWVVFLLGGKKKKKKGRHIVFLAARDMESGRELPYGASRSPRPCTRNSEPPEALFLNCGKVGRPREIGLKCRFAKLVRLCSLSPSAATERFCRWFWMLARR